MKKMFKSRKMLVALCLMLAAVIVAGGTYAWFTWTVSGEKATVEFGRLSITADYGGVTSDLLQPGRDLARTGSVLNTGSLALLAKVDVEEGTVTMRSTPEGVPLAEEDEFDIYLAHAEGITATLDLANMDIAGNKPDGSLYVWLQHPVTKDYYIGMWGDIDAKLSFVVAADGTVGNWYQGATVNYSQGWLATQMIDEAIEEVFGIKYGDLLPAVAPTGRAGVASSASDSLVQQAYAQFLATCAGE